MSSDFWGNHFFEAIWYNIVGRGVLTPYFMRTTPFVAYPPFSNFIHPPPSFLLPPTPPPLLNLLSCFFGWNCTTFDVLIYIIILWMYICWALGPWCVFNATRCKVSLFALGYQSPPLPPPKKKSPALFCQVSP